MKNETEARLQQSAFIHHWNHYPQHRGLLFKVKNENAAVNAVFIIKELFRFLKTRDISIIKNLLTYLQNAGRIAGARDKATGLLPGVSDMILLIPGGQTVFFEFKTETGKQSPAQKEWEEKVNAAGFHYFIIRSLERFHEILKQLYGS